MKGIKAVLVLVLFSAISALYGTSVTFNSTNYSGKVTYNSEVQIGEAIYSRLTIKQEKQGKKRTAFEVKAVMQLLRDSRRIDLCAFYQLRDKRTPQGQQELIASIPVSLWTATDKDYSIKVVFSIKGGMGSGGGVVEKELVLPVSISERKFPSEEIALDEEASAIKEDMTAQRIKEIEELNALLGTINGENVFSTKAFIRPVKSQRMTAHYGDKRVYKLFNGNVQRGQHYGNDYGVPIGTAVYAASDGRVVMAKKRISTGYTLVIEHLPGLYSLYYHLSKLEVDTGDIVRQGNKIALSGDTGMVTGAHLHWEVRLNMSAVLPEFFMQDFTFSDKEE